MSLSTLKSRARTFARLPDSLVSQVDTGASGANLDSEETLALLDAVRRYSAVRPRRLVAAGSAVSGYDQALSTLVSGWQEDTHQVLSVWYPVAQQERREMQASDWVVYQKPDGTWHLRFLVDIPSQSWYLDYSAPHVLTEATDTLSSAAPLDVDAVCHLAASLMLQQAANYYSRQGSTTLSADTVSTENQSRNYSMRAKEERAAYDEHIAGRPRPTQALVDWGRPANGQSDRFWRSRRYQ